jgi:uncharacterized membrane protein YeaQ/YmgE (transglycosylase-associated protein family)
MLGLIVSIIVIGLIAGALARLVVPGRQDISILMTIVLGIVGSFVGGFLGYLIFIGAVIVLVIWIQVGKRKSVRR